MFHSRPNQWGWWKVLQKLWLKFHWYCSLICSSAYVHLKVMIFCNAKKVSKFVFYLLLNVLKPVCIGLTSHVEISISLLKTSRYLGLTKKNAGPTFSLSLTFTMYHSWPTITLSFNLLFWNIFAQTLLTYIILTYCSPSLTIIYI